MVDTVQHCILYFGTFVQYALPHHAAISLSTTNFKESGLPLTLPTPTPRTHHTWGGVEISKTAKKPPAFEKLVIWGKKKRPFLCKIRDKHLFWENFDLRWMEEGLPLSQWKP